MLLFSLQKSSKNLMRDTIVSNIQVICEERRASRKLGLDFSLSFSYFSVTGDDTLLYLIPTQYMAIMMIGALL